MTRLPEGPRQAFVEAAGPLAVGEDTFGNCASCHSAADPQFDMVCEDDHGCDPLPFGDDVIVGVQQGDPRPSGG